MTKLFNVIPNLEMPKEITIVGSSRIILKKKLGKEIDESDFIVRFNFANTHDYKEFTGKKTSLMVINNHVYTSLEKKLKNNDKIKQYLVISPSKLKKFESNMIVFFFERKIKQFLLLFKFIKYSDIFFDLVSILIRKNFSVGFCFILLALASNLKIRIFGFDLNEDMKKRKHYYKKQKIGDVHDLTAEHKVLKKIENLGLLTFY